MGIDPASKKIQYIYIKEMVWAQYIKSKLGITHFAHKYMETSHVASKPKLFEKL